MRGHQMMTILWALTYNPPSVDSRLLILPYLLVVVLQDNCDEVKKNTNRASKNTIKLAVVTEI